MVGDRAALSRDAAEAAARPVRLLPGLGLRQQGGRACGHEGLAEA